MNPGDKVMLRPAGDADDDFLLSVYASTRAEELARVPWPEEQKAAFLRMQFTAQKNHYVSEYPAASHDLICLNAVPVGRLYMERGAERFHILDVTVLPQYRNSGIGSFLLRQILKEAREQGKAVTIYIESFNPSQRLFGHLGFERISEDGFLWLLRWSPASL